MAKKRVKLSREEEEDVVNHMTRQKPELNINTVTINFKCKTENQKKFVKLIKEKDIVAGVGFSGVGKTFLACAEALRLVKTEPQYRKIMLVKSVTSLKGEEVGFLKGPLEDKMAPYMESFKDNFAKLIGKPLADQLQSQGIIQIQPLAFVRGRTIDNTIIIIDEAQNISYDNMKAMLTRIGENSKIIIIGDTKQTDLKDKKLSCLLWLSEKFEKDERFGVTRFAQSDQVRNPIISAIEDMFDEID